MGSVGGGSVHVFLSLILRIFSATYFSRSKIRRSSYDNDKHSRYDYDKVSRAGRLLQAEEIRAVLLRRYLDTVDRDQRPCLEPSLVSADLKKRCHKFRRNGVTWKTVPMPYKGLRSR